MRWRFNILVTTSIRWSSMKTREVEFLVGDAMNQYWVLATVVYNANHHKSCAELPRELQHPLHPKHPLILFKEWKYYDNKEYSKCEVCKKYRAEYSYGCSDCNFNLHNRCASFPLTMETDVHDHPLSRIWKLDKFT